MPSFIVSGGPLSYRTFVGSFSKQMLVFVETPVAAVVVVVAVKTLRGVRGVGVGGEENKLDRRVVIVCFFFDKISCFVIFFCVSPPNDL